MGKQLREPLLRQEVDTTDFDKVARLEAEAEKELAKAKLAALEKIANDKLAKKRLNASEARQIADTTTVPFVHVYKIIRDSATEGLRQVEWSTQNWSDICKERLIKELELDGYILNVQKNFIIISW